ncbi:Colicin V production protein [Caldicellulosiruptor kronotskyensis 2002]|uniref:Colicin V production protein n=1 Tax=Caldicellulosiruptor kronotskyensis (strain DSM 18902 / VKM B-2412 / 2002) TaxID=632348 RepID=E4SHZ2_CALK2|nr:CvpA family protein [Caldicellulosiruptor kronotskyensis]ADQ47367.1 Colicin V production protein [Caldicellulosiruptor kronotskyensis 2002]
MPNTADIVVLTIILVGCWIGYKKGMFRMAFDIGSYIISWFVAVFGYKFVSSFILQSPALKEAIYSFVRQNVVVKEDILPTVPQFFRGAIIQAQQTLNRTLQDAAAVVLANFIAMILIFVGTKIVISVIKTSIGFMRKVPVVGQIDRFLGFVAGATVALIIIYIAFSIFYFFPNAEIFKSAQKVIKTSMFAEFLYENNIIVMLMRQYLKI